MRKLVFVWLLMIFSSVLANEIEGLRSTVQKEKTRVVFDLAQKPVYKLAKIAPYQVALDISGIDKNSPIPSIRGEALGEIVDKVVVARTNDGARYLFVLKWNIDPVLGTLAPQGNYKNHRIYLDFMTDRISGAPRGNDPIAAPLDETKDNRIHSNALDSQANLPKVSEVRQIKDNPNDILNGKSKEIADIKVLTPEEAARQKETMHQNNLKHLEQIRAAENAKKLEAENARLQAIADAKAKKELEAQRIREEKLKQEALKKKAEEEKLRLARDKAEADAKKQADIAKQRYENELKAKAEAEKKRRDAALAKAEAEKKQRALAQAKAEEAKKKAEQLKHNEQQEKNNLVNNKCSAGSVIIAIDAGHGGKDPGAIGANKGYEKNVTLAISRALFKKINASFGMKAILTRSGDYFVELDKRSEIARKKNADILISIHADAAANKSAKGASVLVLNNDRAGRENKKMLNTTSKHDDLLGGASEVLEETAANGESNQYMKNMIIDLTSGKSRDAGYDLANRIIKKMSGFVQMHKVRPDERSLAVLKAPDIPSILVETGFISNEKEEALLKNPTYQSRIAEAIFLAIKDHLADPRYKVNKCK